MGYRPQLQMFTPPGFVDSPFVRPVLVPLDPGAIIPPGGYLNSYAITLDNDAPQIFRSLFIQGGQQGQNLNIQMQLRGADGKYITDGYIPLWLYANGAGVTPPDGGSGRAKVFEPELYCPKGSTILADFFNPGGSAGVNYGPFSLPSQMSPSHNAIQMQGHFVGGQAQGANVFSSGGALYQVLQFVGPPFPAGGSINVYKSINNGITWTILDAAHSPTVNALFPEQEAGLNYDGANTFTMAATTGSVTSATAMPIYFQDFNLLTGTWGAVYGTAGSPSVYGMNQMFKRSDGSILVITLDSLPAGPMTAHVFSGGAWTASFSLSSAFPGGWVANGMASPVYDPLTGTVHMFGIAFVGAVKKQYYQQLLLTNSVAGFQDLTGTYNAATAMGNPIIVGGQICWGVVDVAQTFSTIIVGGPLSAPVFTVAPAPGVNPSQPIPYGASPGTLQPTLATDGTNVWAVVVDNRNFTGAPSRVWLSTTQNTANPLIGWTGSVIYDDATAVHPLSGTFQYPTISQQGSQIFITFQNSSGQPTNYFMDAAVMAQLPYMEFRGVKRYRC